MIGPEAFNRGSEGREAVRPPTRIIVMPGARMVRTKGGNWRFPLVAPDKRNTDTAGVFPGEVSGGTSKMRAIQSLFLKAPKDRNMIVLVTGGSELIGGSRLKTYLTQVFTRPYPNRRDLWRLLPPRRTHYSRSDEAARQLSGKYTPEAHVVSLGGAGSTQGNAEAVMRYLVEHRGTLGEISEIELVENEYKMLRAWIMFSAHMLKRTTNKDFTVTPEHQQRIVEILSEGNTAGVDSIEVHLDKTRRVMAFLTGKNDEKVNYFKESEITIKPISVEETIETNGPNTEDARREEYVRRVRSDPTLLATLQFERQGVIDFIRGNYRKR